MGSPTFFHLTIRPGLTYKKNYFYEKNEDHGQQTIKQEFSVHRPTYICIHCTSPFIWSINQKESSQVILFSLSMTVHPVISMSLSYKSSVSPSVVSKSVSVMCSTSQISLSSAVPSSYSGLIVNNASSTVVGMHLSQHHPFPGCPHGGPLWLETRHTSPFLLVPIFVPSQSPFPVFLFSRLFINKR